MPRTKEVVSINDIPPEVIGAVVLADLAQIEADAQTHPDRSARDRIIRAVTRLRDIAEGNVSPEEFVAAYTVPCPKKQEPHG